MISKMTDFINFRIF